MLGLDQTLRRRKVSKWTLSSSCRFSMRLVTSPSNKGLVLRVMTSATKAKRSHCLMVAFCNTATSKDKMVASCCAVNSSPSNLPRRCCPPSATSRAVTSGWFSAFKMIDRTVVLDRFWPVPSAACFTDKFPGTPMLSRCWSTAGRRVSTITRILSEKRAAMVSLNVICCRDAPGSLARRMATSVSEKRNRAKHAAPTPRKSVGGVWLVLDTASTISLIVT